MSLVMRSLVAASIASGTLLLAFNTAHSQEEATVIAQGSEVSFIYTLSSGGEEIESNKGAEPLTYTQGGGQILPKLEEALEGLKVGDNKEVSLAAADAYGEIDPSRLQEVPVDQIPEDARQVGAMLQSEGYPGPILVKEIKEEVIILDFNHPMAGKDLVFAVEIVEIK